MKINTIAGLSELVKTTSEYKNKLTQRQKDKLLDGCNIFASSIIDGYGYSMLEEVLSPGVLKESENILLKLKMIKLDTNNTLYPIEYEGKTYTQKNVDHVFDSFYHTRESLNGLGGVYMTDGIYIYPDGSMDEF